MRFGEGKMAYECLVRTKYWGQIWGRNMNDDGTFLLVSDLAQWLQVQRLFVLYLFGSGLPSWLLNLYDSHAMTLIWLILLLL